MVDIDNAQRQRVDKVDRQAAQELIGTYHRTQLRALLEHVRDHFARLDAGDIDELELDDVIHHYKRSATALWTFCGSSRGQWQQAANALTYLREQGDEPDWWARGAPRQERAH